MAKNIVGVDFSSKSIRAVEVKDANTSRPTVVRYKTIPVPDGALSRGEVNEPATIATALRQLWSTGGFTSKNVVLGIGNHRVLARDFSVPRMGMQRIRESLPFQVQEMLPVPVEDALLDFYPISETVTDQGSMISGLLVAAVKQSVENNVKAVELAGLTPSDVDLIPFALSRVLLRGQGGRGVVAVIEIGANTSTVVIAKDGVPQFVRIIPTGGSDLSSALRSELGLAEEQAETSKRALGLTTTGVAIENRPIVEVIYRISGELLNSVRNTLNYFSGARPQEPVRQIILSGGGSRLIGFGQALEENVRIPVVMGNPFETLTVDRKFADDAREDRDSVAVALGLALGSAA